MEQINFVATGALRGMVTLLVGRALLDCRPLSYNEMLHGMREMENLKKSIRLIVARWLMR